jgi:hypothetical protein
MLRAFREIVLADFEFEAGQGERPLPVCLVAWELRSGRKFRIGQNQFKSTPPYAIGPDVLFVSYYSSAELGCYRVLGWPMPERILDLFTEFRDRTNGLTTPAGAGRGGLVRGPGNAGGLSIRRPLSGIREACRRNSANATKATHTAERELFKQCVLAVLYGMEAEALACGLGNRLLLPAIYCAHRKHIGFSGAGRTRQSIRPCSPARCTQCLAGTCTSVSSPTAIPAKFSHAGQWSGNVADCFLLATGARGLWPPVHDAVLICAPRAPWD